VLCITVTREQATEILNAVNGIVALLKRPPSTPENQAVMYAIIEPR
jgi:hypothetical protein